MLSLQPIVQEESFSLDPVALQCLNLCGDEKGRVFSKGRVLFVLDLTGQARAKGNHKEKPNPRSSKNRASQACIDGFLREESFYSLFKDQSKKYNSSSFHLGKQESKRSRRGVRNENM